MIPNDPDNWDDLNATLFPLTTQYKTPFPQYCLTKLRYTTCIPDCFLKPGFHVIVHIVLIITVVSNTVQTIWMIIIMETLLR